MEKEYATIDDLSDDEDLDSVASSAGSLDEELDIDTANNVKKVTNPLLQSGLNPNIEDDDDDDDDDIMEADDDEIDYDEMMGGGKEEDEDEDDDEDEDNANVNTKKKSLTTSSSSVNPNMSIQNIINNDMQYNDEDDEDDDEDEDENYLQKFDRDINHNYIKENHTECIVHNYDEVNAMKNVVRDESNIIIDPLHKTTPILTKYERTRVLGQRSKQIESGAKPFIKVPESVIDSYVIAELELKARVIPFIIKRPIPNGSCEYWNLKDLEFVAY